MHNDNKEYKEGQDRFEKPDDLIDRMIYGAPTIEEMRFEQMRERRKHVARRPK